MKARGKERQWEKRQDKKKNLDERQNETIRDKIKTDKIRRKQKRRD